MNKTPYELYSHLQTKGYIVPMEGQITVENLPLPVGSDGKPQTYSGTGEKLKNVMEIDRRNVYKFYFGETEMTESTWLAGDEAGHGMLLPLWAERLIHADVLVMQEKIDSTIEYLLHHLGNKQ